MHLERGVGYETNTTSPLKPLLLPFTLETEEYTDEDRYLDALNYSLNVSLANIRFCNDDNVGYYDMHGKWETGQHRNTFVQVRSLLAKKKLGLISIPVPLRPL